MLGDNEANPIWRAGIQAVGTALAIGARDRCTDSECILECDASETARRLVLCHCWVLSLAYQPQCFFSIPPVARAPLQKVVTAQLAERGLATSSRPSSSRSLLNLTDLTPPRQQWNDQHHVDSFASRAASRLAITEYLQPTVLLNIGKCLTFRFLLHRGRFHGSPGTDVSAILSAGCHRGTRGEMHQVDCRVAIPIVDDAACNA